MEYYISEKTEQELKNMKFSLIGQVFRQLKLIKGKKEISDEVMNETFDKLDEMNIEQIKGALIRLDSLLKKVMEERMHPEIKWKREKIRELEAEIKETNVRMIEFKKNNEDQAIMVPLDSHKKELIEEWKKLTGRAYFVYD